MIREICKAGWLQQKVEKRAGGNLWSKGQKSIFLPEKWYVLCIHDDRSPFLEVYSNDEGVNRHEPLETLNLNECQYITTAIEDDRTFVIAFQNNGRNSLELAALSALERREWMDMLRFKLTRLGCLESGANIYSPFPVSSTPSTTPPAPTTRAFESPATENPTTQSFSRSSIAEEAIQHIYEPPRRSIVSETIITDTTPSMAPISHLPLNEGIYEPISHVPRSSSRSPEANENVQDEQADGEIPSGPSPLPRYSVIRKEEKPVLPPRNGPGATWSGGNSPMEIAQRRSASRQDSESTCALYDVPRALFSPLEALASSPPRPSPPLRSNIERYDLLPMESTFRGSAEETTMAESEPAMAPEATGDPVVQGTTTASPVLSTSFSFDNAGFDDGEDSARRYANGPLAESADIEFQDADRRGPYSALSLRPRMVPWAVLSSKSPNSSSSNVRAQSNSPSNQVDANGSRSRSRSVTTIDHPSPPVVPPPLVLTGAPTSVQMVSLDETPSPPTSPPPAPPLPLPNSMTMPVGSGRVVPLKETEVERLRSEMESTLHVKAQVLLEHLVNENGQLMGLALVDMMGFVWIAGWLKRFTKQFSAGLHIGDRLDSIFDPDGKAVAINSVAKAEQVLKVCWKRRCGQVSLFVKRLPLGQVYVLKRAANGDPVGIVLKSGKNEILGIEDGKAASRAGMRAQCKSTFNSSDALVNYFITEVNGRPLNVFSRDGEAQKRLNAVGTELTVLVQPSDFVKELRKKLKHKKGYKEYVIG